MARRDDVEPPGVDFLVGGAEPGFDEDLQPDIGSTVRSRLRTALVVLVVIALLGALIVRGVATHQPNPVAASASDTPTSDRSPPTEIPIVIREEPSPASRSCPRADSGRSLCIKSTKVDAAVLTAVRSRFYGVRITSVLDEELRDVGFGAPGLWYRSIHATWGSTHLAIAVRVVRVGDAPLRSTATNPGGTTTIAVQRLTAAFTVRVSATAPNSHLPGFGTLAALAGDSRLVG